MYVTTKLDNETEGARLPGQGLGQGHMDKVTWAMSRGAKLGKIQGGLQI